MQLCQLFIDKNKSEFMLMKMPDEVTPDNYQGWVSQKESESTIQAFEFPQKLLDQIAMEYLDENQTDAPYEAKYVLMKAPDEEALFISSLELSRNDDEKLDVVRNGLLIVFDKNELQHFSDVLQKAWSKIN
ncbi:hypothetical protein [Lactobacillus helveticus]|uniref:Uncharacterized protein n=1 Tax=Lactobacillus helveticus TaxID=1587 RepID=A0AAC8W9H4_LACHE|nr:hypothetical protein [Lactobacillus helveticus]ALI53095.1 hypothetical protein ALV80_08665 [Lactobacillus helveticus]NRN80500.1 hypothetical protein [Lactobacillus helveticus]NRN97192.1 hypothetical protein [Lactobacillus helveticus]NRO24033.1 hypothetical protein [Lactobacillus helveticus]